MYVRPSFDFLVLSFVLVFNFFAWREQNMKVGHSSSIESYTFLVEGF